MGKNDDEQPRRRTASRRRQRFIKERPPRESADTPWRLFIAVPLPDSVRELITRIIAELRRGDWPVRWSSPDGAHLTLHFLGDTPPEHGELLRLALVNAISNHDAFDLRTADLGAFPSLKRPRVLWLGLWGPTHRLEAIRRDVGTLLESFSVEVNDKEFHPHITFGRVRDTRNVSIRDLPAAIRTRFDELSATGQISHEKPIPFPVQEVHLVRSHLSHDGAQYEVIGRYPLKTPTST